MSAQTYDVERARRDRLRRAEQLADTRGRLLDEAIRLLGIVCQLAAGDKCAWSTVLAIAEIVDGYQPDAIDRERLLELLGGPA
jgi:hypothetical protein